MNYEEWKEELNREAQQKNSEHTEAESAETTAETPASEVNQETAGQAESAETAFSADTAEASGGADTAEASAQTETAETAAQTGAAEPAEAAEPASNHPETAETVTYSWVNPKLRTGRSAGNTQSTQSTQNNTWRWSDTQSGQNTQQGQSGRSSYSYTSNASQTGSGASGSPVNGGGTDSRRNNTSGRKSSGNRRKSGRKSGIVRGGWMRTIAAALVFGLIAGSVMFGVNRAGNAIFGSGQKVSSTNSQSYPKIATTSTTEKPSENLSDALDESTKVEGEKAQPGTVAEVANNAMPALVTISTMSVQEMQSFFGGTQSYEVEGAGTGVIVDMNESELLIATNNHVVDGAKEVTVGFIDETAVEAFIKGTDTANDLAIVGVKLENIPQETLDQIRVIAIGNSDDLVLGEQVVAIGNALGYGQSVTSGYVSAFDRELELSDGTSEFVSSGLIQTDAAINSGNSGGALLNMQGELVGINEAKVSGSGYGASVDNVGYSIPISKAEPILKELMSLETKEKVAEDEKGYLGILCADVNQETSERYNIPVGVYVRQIAEGGPAEEAGLMEGDVITKIDNRTVSEYSDLENALNYCKAGESIDVVVQRQENGQYTEKTISVKLGKSAVLDSLNNEEDTQREVQSGQFGD